MKNIFLIATTITTSSVTLLNGQQFPCNPANFCPPNALLCKNSEVIAALVRGEEIPDDGKQFGACSDGFRWDCNKNGFNCVKKDYTPTEAWERCRKILYPDPKNYAKFPPGKFVESCREGYFTCKNGVCATSASGCSSNGGVRYSNVRCAKDECGDGQILNTVCQMQDNPTQAGVECQEIPQGNVPACCVDPLGARCRFLTIDQTSAANSDDIISRQCGGECPTTCDSKKPTKAPTKKGPTKPTAAKPTNKPTEAQPTNQPTASKPTKKPAPTKQPAPTSEPAPTNEVTPKPTPETSPGSQLQTTGVIISFKPEESQTDCCCTLSCSCFGDPHCTSFFGNQQVSKVSTGSYNMFSNEKIKFEAFLGPPLGIIEKVEVKVAEDPRTFMLSSKFCSDLTKNWQDAATGEFVTDIPSNWEILPSVDPDGSGSFSDPTIYIVRDTAKNPTVNVRIKCQPFLYGSGSNYQRKVRLDVSISVFREKTVNPITGQTCCPTEAQNEEWFVLTGASGFCVNPAATPLPGGSTGRRSLTSDFSQYIVKSETENLRSNEILSTSSRNLKTAEEVCKEYLDKVGKGAIAALDTMEECLKTIGDFGIGSIEALIDLIDKSPRACISDASDPRLPGPNGLSECEQGAILQAQIKNTGPWISIQSFPAGFPYCNDRIIIDYSRMQVAPGVPLTANDGLRISQCAPNPETCGVCTPLFGLDQLAFTFTYECETYKNYKESTKQIMIQGLQNGDFSCGFKYKDAKDPLQCVKDFLPELEL